MFKNAMPAIGVREPRQWVRGGTKGRLEGVGHRFRRGPGREDAKRCVLV